MVEESELSPQFEEYGLHNKMANLNRSECNNATEYGEDLQHQTFWIDLFTRDIMAGLGIIGNILILVILVQRHMRNTFNKLLVALALSDTAMLITCIVASTLMSSKDVLGAIYPLFLWPLRHISITISMFLTVTIAWERLLAVSDPYSYKSNQQYRATKYVTSVTIAAVILNVGKFFEIEATHCRWAPGLFFGSVKPAALLKNQTYGIYNTVILKLLITGLIPIVLLICMYTKIYLKIREHRLKLAQHNNAIKTNIMREHKLAGIFVGVVISSLICTIPEVMVKIQSLLFALTSKRDYDKTLLKVRDIFAILNSAINIIIYTCLSKAFREEFIKFFISLLRNPLKSRKKFTPASLNAENELITSNSNVETREMDQC